MTMPGESPAPPPSRVPRWAIPAIAAGSFVLTTIAVVIALAAANAIVAPLLGVSGSGPRNMASFGVQLVGSSGGAVEVLATPAAGSTPARPRTTPSGAKSIVEYVDLSCPACRDFETATLSWTLAEVQDGRVTLELRPIAILDRLYQGSGYSTRINAATACVADGAPEHYVAFVQAAYAGQPDENSAGLTDADIVRLASSVGASAPAVSSCISSHRFASWVDRATATAIRAGASQTPTVYVDGKYYQGGFDLGAFQAFVASA